jgi:hypothetical protein
MCDYCKPILEKCITHTTSSCPLKKGSYCTYCSNYGHSTKQCAKDSSYRRLHVEETDLESPIGVRTAKYMLDYVDEPKAIRA